MRLEADRMGLPVPERLLLAAGRLLDGRPAVAQRLALRGDQVPVFRHFAGYLEDVATRPAAGQERPRCRIVLPPRTGKTIIAGHIIAHTGLVSTVVVPTRALVEQTVRELRQLMPEVPLGAFYGDAKTPVAHGVNVTTYASLKRHLEMGSLPAPLQQSSLVFVDEAHHAMTPGRLDALERAFAPEAVRVALTATPDYDHERRLARHFPHLIHQIDLGEALALGLLAPVRVWVAEVDADASTVRLLAGDYDVERLGQLMSSGPFFGAVRAFRYQGKNGTMPGLIACASRQQARDLWAFLSERRPPGRPPPALILGETPGAERERALADFAAGRLDTLVQVGVLIEGWSSPRCKLLIDLAPSVSRVRATQKYFRAMTRHGDQEARIVVLLPRSLPRPPVLPMDLLMSPGEEYYCGALIGDEEEGHHRRPLVEGDGSSIAQVTVRQRVLVCASLERPTLDPRDGQEVREVLEACPDFDPERPATLPAFRRLWLSHRQFKGSGESLLRWCGVPYWRRGTFLAFMAWLYPEAVSARYGEVDGERWTSCEEELEHLLARARREGGSRLVGEVLLGLGGAGLEDDPERRVLRGEEISALSSLVKALPPRRRWVLERRFGIGPDPSLTLRECGEQLGVCPERVRGIEAVALRTLRRRRLGTVLAC